MRARAWPPVGVALLLAVAAFGLAGRDRVALTLEPVTASTAAAWVVLLAASAAWIGAATLVVARTSLTAELRPAFRKALVIDLALTGLVLLLVVRSEAFSELIGAPAGTGSPVLPAGLDNEFDLPWVRYVFAALLVLVVLIAVGLLAGTVWWTRGRFFVDHGRVVRDRRFGRGQHGLASPEAVLDAVRRARRALASDDDAARAVIAAYAAMEQAVASSGVDRRSSQTPGEFLREALDSGVLRDEASAHRLLGLFELARFSHEGMPADAVIVADACLGALQDDLEGAVR
ncbi:MAG: DUF4129 domain-containing protein [Propionibacteriales bacterium]|nr:DUF4129 domain-containing protein [Propionibacteriales bacterium]